MKEYFFEDIIKVVRREKNKNRKFLFLNLLQGKYVPSNPSLTLELFETLGNKLAEKYNGKNICVIGFAETATAIAATVANCFTQTVYFLHTTREEYSKEYFVTEFEEEHSHAKQHRLYCQEKEILQKSDMVILVDDEFTTGKTICNLVRKLREHRWIGKKCTVVAASLINCMREEYFQRFRDEEIEWEYLLRKNEDWEKINWASGEKGENRSVVCGGKEKIEEKNRIEVDDRNKSTVRSSSLLCSLKEISIKREENPRLGIYNHIYQKACEEFAWEVMDGMNIDSKKKENILVLGTEEYMYPAIYAANRIQMLYPNKFCSVHATSRSPIVSMEREGYPIYRRDKIISFYDKKREVYLYNLQQYQKVLILTDARSLTEEAKACMESTMSKYGNHNLTLFQWTY